MIRLGKKTAGAPPTIHVWVPDYVSATGGIQTFSRFTLRALRDLFPRARIIVLSKNDTSYPDPFGDPTDHFTPLGWWPAWLRTAAFSVTLLRSAVRERPDFIFTTHVNFAPVAYLLLKLFGIPFVAVGHGVEVWEIPKASVRRALRNCSSLMAVSNFTQRRMAEVLQVTTRKIGILPNTFDPEQFRPTDKPRFLLKRYNLTAEQPVILTIARLASAERYKGYDQVLKALPTVARRIPNLRYILGGSGPDRSRIESLIGRLGLQENVILPGYIAAHELREHYNLCDAFAMPSKGEGFGIVFLEALGCGKPVIAGNRDGSADALLDGRAGLLVDPDSIDEIAGALSRVLAGTHHLRALYHPDQLRRQVIDAFGYDRFVETLSDLLRPVTRRAKGRKPDAMGDESMEREA